MRFVAILLYFLYNEKNSIATGNYFKRKDIYMKNEKILIKIMFISLGIVSMIASYEVLEVTKLFSLDFYIAIVIQMINFSILVSGYKNYIKINVDKQINFNNLRSQAMSVESVETELMFTIGDFNIKK